MSRSARWGLVLSVACLGVLGASLLHSAPATQPTTAATRPAAPPKPVVPPATVESAVTALIAEANERFVPNTKLQITLIRPHASVARVPVSDAPKVLSAMKGKLTGDALKDVYIRYHLMDVVNRALPTALEPFTNELLALAPLIPPDIVIELKPWWAYDPEEVGMKYRRLIDSCALTIGFPPFARRVDAPDSFQYMDPKARAKAEANYAEAKSLEGKFKSTMSQENHVYNYKVIWMNWLVRQYRGELLYAMVAQGDKNALDLITDAVTTAAAKDPIRAADLIAFLNAAYFNGYLGKYDAAALKRTATKLRAAGAASEQAARAAAEKGLAVKGPKVAGPTMSTGWINGGGRWRQVAESLFTIVYGIENSRVPRPIAPELMGRPLVPTVEPRTSAEWMPVSTVPVEAKPVKPVPVTQPATRPVILPQDVTLDMIDAAMAKAAAALEQFRPPDVDLNWCSYLAKRLPANYWYSDFTLPGQGALTTWAMLAAGEPFKEPWFQRRIGWVQCYDSPTTYDRAMRLMLLSNLRYQGMDPWLKRDAMWLADTMTEQGNWEARNIGLRSTSFGDNANGQYAILALFAADQAGIDIPMAIWQKADKYWRQAQRPPGAPGDGGWAVTSSASLAKGANLNAFANRVSGPMTAGGVLSLHFSEMHLYGAKRAELGQPLSPELTRGIQWLDEHFSMDDIDGDQDFYYYLWTMQNVGQATGLRTFNNVDWFRAGLARLLNNQQPSGLWKGPKGEHVSTSFAMLYLARARGPLAICKVRFEPSTAGKSAKTSGARDLARVNAWNNRPNDLYNFVTDLSNKLEVPSNWQIVELDQPVYELIESPVLYLATDKPFKLSPEHVSRLREYVEAGGTVVCAPEGRNLATTIAAMNALAAEVCPGIQPKKYTDNSHPYFSFNGKIKTPMPIHIYGTSTRTKVVVVEKDLSHDLQADSPKERDAFTFLMNVYLYSSGREPARPRIVTNYLTQKNLTPKVQVQIARLKTGSNAEAEPMSMPQLKAFLADRHDIDLQITEQTPESLSGSPAKLAFLTVTEKTQLTSEQAATLRRWSDSGNILFIDVQAGTSVAVDQLDQMLAALQVTTDDLKPLNEHPIMTGDELPRGYKVLDGKPIRAYRNEANSKVTFTGKLLDGRPSILVSRGDVMVGVAGMNQWGISGFSPAAARELAANTVLSLLPKPPKPQPATAPATRSTTRPALPPTSRPATLPTTNPVAAK